VEKMSSYESGFSRTFGLSVLIHVFIDPCYHPVDFMREKSDPLTPNRMAVVFLMVIIIGLPFSRILRFAFDLSLNVRTAMTTSVVGLCIYPILWRSGNRTWSTFARHLLSVFIVGLISLLSLSLIDYYWPD